MRVFRKEVEPKKINNVSSDLPKDDDPFAGCELFCSLKGQGKTEIRPEFRKT